MNVPMYFVLFLITIIRSTIIGGRRASNVSNWYYLIASLGDVEGNVLLLSAYSYTNITSVSLLDCFAIPIVMALSVPVFGRSYSWQHFLSVSIVLSGMALLVFQDHAAQTNENHGSNPLLGDILVLCGATCYAISNTMQEYIVKFDDGIWNYLSRISLLGFTITLVQGLIFEGDSLLHHNRYDRDTLLCYMGYLICICLFYIAVPMMLQHSSSVVFNLSILTTDVYVVIAARFLFAVRFDLMYMVAFVVILFGVVLFNVVNHRQNR